MTIKRRHAWLAGVSASAVVGFFVCAGVGVRAAGSDARLIDAVKAGNRAAAAAIVKQPGVVNSPEQDGTTALHWAVRGDDAEMVKLLLAAGADVKAANRYGVRPLGLAAVNGNAALVKLLLAAGADPNATVSDAGETPLMSAARTGRVEPLRLLLSKGASVNVHETEFGETALMWAASENHADAVRLLVEHGADLNAKSAHAPATRARGRIALGEWTPLMYASRQGAMDSTRVLVDLGADINARASDGSTALILAIINSHYELASMLVGRGADPNVADSTGMAPLYAAVDMNTLSWAIGRAAPKQTDEIDSLDMIRLLLEWGADPNATLKTRKLARGQNAGDPDLGAGSTALMRAAKTGDLAAMHLLLDYGADPTLRQKNGTTLFMIAAGMGWRGGFDTNRHRGTEAGAIETMKLCLALGAEVNAVNEEKQNALHGAVGRGESVLEFLVAHGADLHARDKKGQTPLDLAISLRDFDTDTDHVGPEIRSHAVVVLERLGGVTTPASQPRHPATSSQLSSSPE